MRRNIVPEKVVSDSPCVKLADKTRTARKAWTALHSALQACFISAGESKDYVLDPFALLHVCSSVRSEAILLAEIGDAALAEAEAWARKEAQAATLAFDGELRKLCAEEKVSVEGRFPSYVLEGYLILRLSPDEGTCTVGVQKVTSLLARRIWLEIRSTLKEERLRGVTPDDFLASCQTAYQRAIAIRNAKMGDSIPIRDLFRELVITLQPDKFWRSAQRQNLAEYTEEYFCRDLARLMAAGRFVTQRGAKMELMPTAFAKDGIAVSVGEGVRFIGHVTFGEPER